MGVSINTSVNNSNENCGRKKKYWDKLATCVASSLGSVTFINQPTTVAFRPTQQTHTPQVQNMLPNTDHARSKHIWTIIRIFEVVLTVHRRLCVEIKCHLDATDVFYCRSYCLLNMFRAPLCPSSGAREYYTAGCCLWSLVLGFQVVSCVSGLRAA
jgi:hypothetical protein